MDIEYDKKLVQEGTLLFKKDNSNLKYILTDDGMIEKYNDTKLESVTPFAKLSILRECKTKVQEGYTLDTNNNIDTEQTTQELQAEINAVDKLQDLKDELDTKVNKLVSESEEPIVVAEPTVISWYTTPFTSNTLTKSDILNLTLDTLNLDDNQILFLVDNGCEKQDLLDGLYSLVNNIGLDNTDEVITVDDYVIDTFGLNPEDVVCTIVPTEDQVVELTEEATQCSSVASGVNGRIDSFPINPKEMKKSELNESSKEQELNDTERTCVDEVVSTYKIYKGKKSFEDIVDDVVGRYNEANTLPEYEEEEFYNEEADYHKVTTAAINELQPYLNELMQKDFEAMLEMKDEESIKTYLYDIVQNQRYDEAKTLLSKYLNKAITIGSDEIKKAIDDILQHTYNVELVEAKSRDEISDEEYKKRMNSFDEDLDKMVVLKDVEEIKAFIYKLIENLNYDKAKSLLESYLQFTIIRKESGKGDYKKVQQAIEDVFNTSFHGVPTSKELFPSFDSDTTEDSDENKLFDDREELLDYLNKNTDYSWDANEIYSDCVIYENENGEDIEVFVETEDGKKVYTVVDDYNIDKYNSLADMLNGLKTIMDKYVD